MPRGNDYAGPLQAAETASFVRRVLENAAALIDDARCLFNHSRYARANALAILGLEEIAKAIMVIGTYVEDDTPEGWASFWKQARSHQTKLRMSRFALKIGPLDLRVEIQPGQVVPPSLDAPLKIRSRQSPETERPNGLACMVAGSLEEDYRPPPRATGHERTLCICGFRGRVFLNDAQLYLPGCNHVAEQFEPLVRSRTPVTIIGLILIPRSAGLSPQPRTGM